MKNEKRNLESTILNSDTQNCLKWHQSIKNNYPLPLILDIVENIGTKKVFTKMDLR